MNTGVFRIASMFGLLGYLMLQSCTNHQLSEPVDNGDSLSTPVIPVLSSFTPEEGAEGSLVRLRGEGFGTDRSVVTVRFGDVSAEVISLSDTEIVVRLPFAPHNSVITVVLKGHQATSSHSFHIWFNAGSYRHGLVEISNAGITKTISESHSVNFDRTLAVSHSGHYDVTESFTRSVEHCGNGCDSGASPTTIVICCSPYPWSQLSLTAVVDTVSQRFRQLYLSHQEYFYSDTAEEWLVEVGESLHLADFPYTETPDGSLVCSIPFDQLLNRLSKTYASMRFTNLTSHYPNDQFKENEDSSTYVVNEFNGLSQPEAYVRVTLKR